MIQRKFLKACHETKIDIVKQLLEKERHQIKINDCGNDQKTPLHHAIVNSSIEMVELLTDCGCDVNRTSISVVRNETSTNDFFRFDEPPIVTAARVNNAAIAEYLMKRGSLVTTRSVLIGQKFASTDDQDIPGTTALHYAAYHHNAVLLEQLLRWGSNVNSLDYDGNVPLHMAMTCRTGSQGCRSQKAAAKLLCDNRADTSAKNRRSWTPLLLSVLHGCLSCVEILLSSPSTRVNIKSFAPHGQSSPLHVASFKDRHDILLLVVSNDHELDSLDHKLMTPLQVNATTHCSSPVAATLIYHGCDVNCLQRSPTFPSLMTILLKNPRFDCESLAYMMLKAGYDLNQDVWLLPDFQPQNSECLSRDTFFNTERLDQITSVPTFNVPKGRLENLRNWLRQKLREPKKLSDLCRIVIRRSVYVANERASISKPISTLDLPRSLRSFLLFGEFTQQSDAGILSIYFEY